jgi:flagellar biosynthesis protein FlhG
MEQPHFYIGQKLSFTTDSELYHDTYVTEVKEVFPDRLELAISLHKGYLLLFIGYFLIPIFFLYLK